MTTTPMITLNKLKKTFPVPGSGRIRAVEDVSLTIYKGEKLGVVGESGCGKSTLGRVILQLYRQTSGACVYYGKTLQEVNPRYLGREVKKLPIYQRKAKQYYQQSLQMDLKARAWRMRMDEVSARANASEERRYHRYSKKADMLAFRAKELRKDASRQLREGSRTVGSLILTRDLPEVCRLYKKARLALKEAHSAYEELIWQGKLLSGGTSNDTSQAIEERLTAHMADAATAINEAETYKHQNISEITERCFDPAYWARLDGNQETGINLGKLTGREMRGLRRDMQVIFQDPAASLDPRESIGKAVEEPFRIHTNLGKKERKERTLALLQEVGLKPEHYDYYPHQLSGGQKQRAGIARAIALKPRFVVLDESISALDVSVQAQILQLLNTLQEQYGLTYFFITHNLGVVKHFCDRVMVMYLGGVCETAPVERLFKKPLHPYTVSLLASVPKPQVPDGEMTDAPLTGEVPSALNPPSGCTFHTRCPKAMPVCASEKPLPVMAAPGHSVACHLYQADKQTETSHA